MTREVLVKIRGFQQIDDDIGEVEVIAPGDYFLKNGKHYVIYDETEEGFEEPVHNTVRISRETVDIRKTGLVTAHMIFTRGQAEETRYETPFGEMVIGTHTRGIQLDEGEDHLLVKIRYSLDINYEHAADSSIEIGIFSRENAQLGLLSDN